MASKEPRLVSQKPQSVSRNPARFRRNPTVSVSWKPQSVSQEAILVLLRDLLGFTQTQLDFLETPSGFLESLNGFAWKASVLVWIRTHVLCICPSSRPDVGLHCSALMRAKGDIEDVSASWKALSHICQWGYVGPLSRSFHFEPLKIHVDMGSLQQNEAKEVCFLE